MRLFSLIFLLACWAAAAPAPQQAPSEKAEAGEEKPISSPPRIERSGGVVIIRGSTSQSPPPAEEPESEEAEAESAEQEEAARDEAPQPPRLVRSSGLVRDASGDFRPSRTATVVEREDGTVSKTQILENLNGRAVPYLTEQEKVVSSSGGTKVSERRTQRYDKSGRPSQQELVRVEERKLPDGSVERTETLYRENLNGRMEAVERSFEVTREQGAVTTTAKRTEKPSINGRFQTVLREESTERKRGENKATRETVRRANVGGRLQVVAREESTMTRQGAVATTETKRYERQAVSGDMALSTRSVGRLEERPDGTSVERVETYGFRTAGGAFNLNTNRPALQEVVERRQTVQPDGSVRERISVRGRSGANPSEMGPPTVTETVSRPTADGAQVRTEVYEQGVNGRLRPTQVVLQEIEK